LLSFSAPVTYNIGTQSDTFVPNAAPINVVTADFNGDGKLDLVVAHKAENSVYFLAGNGDGAFQSAVQIPIGEAIEGREFVGDFNNDGKLDLFLPGDTSTANHPIILLGNGNGTFQPRIDSSSFAVTGTYPRGWCVGDFTGDGKLDIAVTLPSTTINDAGGYLVLPGNGDGTFKAAIVGPLNALHYSRWSTAADVNGDGKLDLITADGQGVGDQVGTAELSVLLGNGDGTFQPPTHYSSPQTESDENVVVNPEDVMVADVNHDGRLDAIVSDYDHNINVFLGNGDGAFQQAMGIPDLEYPRDVVATDVNGDGVVDLVVGNLGVGPGGSAFAQEGTVPGSVSILLGNDNGTFQPAIQYNSVFYPGWAAVGDFNGDDRPDLAITQVSNGHSVNVMLDHPTADSPTLVTPAMAIPNPLSVNSVPGSTVSLSALGGASGGESTLTYTWSVITKPSGATNPTFSINGTNAAKNTVATFNQAGLYAFLVTIANPQGATTTSSVQVSVAVNQKPTVATAAKATPSPVTGTTTALSVLGADDGGSDDLIYTWATTGTPPAPVVFSANGTHDAQNTTATFTQPGVYNFLVTITDAEGLSTTSPVSVTVNQTLAMTVTPTNGSVVAGGTLQFSVTAKDQFGNVVTSPPNLTWSVTGGGAIDGTGLFTAGSIPGGPFTVTATSGSSMSFAAVNIIGTDGTRILTVYSMAGDGKIAYFASTGAGQAQWDAVHDTAVGNAPDYTSANRVNFAASGLGGSGIFLARGFLPFDTSSLPANAVITSASMGLFVTGTSDTLNDGNDFVTVTRGYEASATSLTVNDYNKAGNATDDPTEGGNRIDITSIPANSYIQWNLNAAGMSWITPGGVSQFAVREGHDALDIYDYQTNQADSINAYMSEQPGTSQDPYLQITYTIPNQPPSIASLSAGANPVTLPRSLTLTTTGVSDSDGSVASVAFYRESNNIPGLQTGVGGDAFVGNGSPGSQPGVWSYTADVTNWPAGRIRFYAVAADNLGASSPTGAGAPTTQSGILPFGDANGDYTVNALDFNILATNFGRSGATWFQGDFNNDGNVNTADFSLLAANFGTTTP
jgi:hypothetical protein